MLAFFYFYSKFKVTFTMKQNVMQVLPCSGLWPSCKRGQKESFGLYVVFRGQLKHTH